ncbi:SCP2 sterol-binding domain-containing protein [Halomarina salina]|uniref:SCP2 sterol-binding domain-containing protein n=1 Tax=Halomarina salina TaxID=1872699 RepID=A0ABD5RQF2_9EURY|nr:SCP2 sterol-binding domain-containing protein [Halomarina salina]
MVHEFPSEEWMAAWRETVNADEEYAEAAAEWGVDFDGDMVFHLTADDRLPEDRLFFVALEGGRAHETYEIDSLDDADYGFVFRGTYTDWVDLTEGDVGAIDGLMTGRFELDGDMQRVLQFSDAAARLVDLASAVDSDYRY